MAKIVELTTDIEWREALPVLRELRPDLDVEKAVADRAALMARGYKLFGLISRGKIANEDRFVCLAGVVVQPHILRGNDFWVHDLVTVSDVRSKGYGEEMMRFLERQAQALGCSRLSVHTRLNRDRAQNFYEHHLDYDRYAVVFQKDLK